MTTFLRKVNKPASLTYYDRAVVQEEFGLEEGEYLSDLLADFSTEDGEFSIFEVEPSDPDGILLVICAIAAKSLNWSRTGYLLFDARVFDNPDIASPVKAPGETANPDIDDRHYNVPVKTTNRLTQITNIIIEQCLDTNDIFKPDMKSHLIKYGQRGMLPNAHERIKRELDFI